MITQFHLQDFKAHRDTRLALEQLTMLVGDNASGKTSVLQALHLQMAVARNPEVVLGRRFVPGELCRRGAPLKFTLTALGRVDKGQIGLELAIQVDDPSWMAFFNGSDPQGTFRAYAYVGTGDRDASLNNAADWDVVRAAASTAELYRLEPEKIAEGSYSDQPDTPVRFDGSQTATVLAALKLDDDEAFDQIESALRELIPSLQRIRIKPETVMRPIQKDLVVGNKVYFDFRGSPGVPAHHASYGTLILLALLTVLHGRDRRPNLILLDDFDHALHPRAQMDLVRMLRKLLQLESFRETQIIATTHSPYVLDELPPENVIAFALRDDGTVASKPLSEHPDALKAKGALKSGELWSLDPERTWVL